MSRTVLVTGASSGIGAAIARLLSTQGFTVFGTTRAEHPVSPPEYSMLSLDVDSEASAKQCVDQVLSKAGRLDVLVNNAGYALTGAAEETTIAEAKGQFETNFFGVVRMTNAALPAMRAAGPGRIITIGSLAGLTAIPFCAFYSATKFALEAYSESLWHEVRPLGISVSLIEPGWVRTSLNHASHVAAESLPVYDAPRNRVVAAIAQAVEKGAAPEAVARVVLRAAASRHPQLRYPVGFDAHWLPRLRSMFAVGIVCAGSSAHDGHGRKQVGPEQCRVFKLGPLERRGFYERHLQSFVKLWDVEARKTLDLLRALPATSGSTPTRWSAFANSRIPTSTARCATSPGRN